ncbi:helix-turn-helix domain-containing protein [Streptomyces sp. NPDC102476]|uniref:MmyB family transcriptional regulator n=1 Tax=Streptomyces sp. NPDC102476 TaxID=3366181 RepID=UPI003817DF1B
MVVARQALVGGSTRKGQQGMHSGTIGQTLRSYRTRSGQSTRDVAYAAGLTTRQYEALETGSGWPGARAFTAAIEALRIPAEARSGLDFCGRPLDTALKATLRGFTMPAIMVDHRWRVVGANTSAVQLLPELGQPGWSLLRWILCSSEARRRLVNAADVTKTFAKVLRQAYSVAPFDADLRALLRDVQDSSRPLHEGIGGNSRTSHRPGLQDVDGLELVWRTKDGPYQMISLFTSVPARRPDLLQIVLHIEPLILPEQEQEPDQWSDALLAGIAYCRLCGPAMTYEEGRVYRCSAGCSFQADATALEDQLAQELLPRIYTETALTGLAQLQEVLIAGGGEPALPAPVSVRHALYQWRYEMPLSARRGLVASWVAGVAVSPAEAGPADPGRADTGFDLDICWLPGL